MSDTETRAAASSVRAYLDELFAFYGDEEPEDLLDCTDYSGASETTAYLRLSDLRALVTEAERLRDVVEAVRALPAMFRSMADDRTRRGERVANDEALAEALVFAGNCYRLAAAEVERVLASVPSSGETGERDLTAGYEAVWPSAPASPEPTGADEDVNVEGSTFRRADLPVILGNYMRALDAAGHRLAARPVLSRQALRARLVGEPYRLADILCHSEHPDVANSMTGFATKEAFYVSCVIHKAKADRAADAILDVLGTQEADRG